MNRIIRLIVLTVMVASVAFSQSPVTFESLYSFESVSGLKLSPDKTTLAFTTRKSDVETNRSVTSLWLMDTDGSHMRRISEEGKSVRQVRWTGDGKLVYIMDGQVWVRDPAADAAESVTSGISNFVWSPTGRGVLFTRRVFPENNGLDYFDKRKKFEKETNPSGRLYDGLLYRPYSRWDDGTVSHIFYLDFETNEMTDVTPGEHHAPAQWLGGDDIAFSPDGRRFAFTMNTDSVQAVSTNNDVFIADIDGGNRRRVSVSPGCDTNPRFSPDGHSILYLQMARAGYEADQKDILLVDLKTRQRRNLTETFDRTVRDAFWSEDGQAIYFTCGDQGHTALHKIDVATGRRQEILNGVCFSNMNVDEKGACLYLTKSEMDRPYEVFKYDMRSTELTQLTRFSESFVNTHQLATSKEFWYKGAQGDDVQGFVTYPADFEAGQKYPVVLLFHGGPEGAWRADFSNYGWNVHVLASKGFFVVKINPHGSNSYGLKFQEDLIQRWGEIDVQDVMKGLDYLFATYPAMDRQRVGALGRSYGGYLVNFLNGVTDRFRCFVSVDGIFDLAGFYYATDELWFMEYECGGTPWQQPEVYRKSSPATYAADFRTPALIIHGGRDYRVDDSQGFGMYTALQRQGIASQLLFFPDEPHYYRKLTSWQYAYQVQLDWLDKWLK